MRDIFYPGSVAVVGVSASSTNLGRNIVLNLIDFGFDGIVYAVGPKGGAIATNRIFKSVMDIPDHVDLAVILVPAKIVPEVMEECGQKGVRRVIIETAGFGEFNDTGRALERQVIEIAEKYDIRWVGPNCIGVINMENGFCVPFPRLSPFIKKGDVSIISQSGGVGLSIMNHMSVEGIGLNKFVSVGNMTNTDSEDLLEYLIEDPGTKIIFIYVESLRDGRRLMSLARSTHKPILVFKSNIGQLGKNIAKSHTGALSSDDRVVDSAFAQCGVTRILDVTTLSNYLKTLRMPSLEGKRLAIISRSGGHAIIAADACELAGFELADFPETFIQEIEKHFRASVIKLTNPLDLGDLFEPDVYVRIVEDTLTQDNVDGVVFLHTSIAHTDRDASGVLVDRLARLSVKYRKPVAVYVSAEPEEITQLKRQADFPIFTHIVETFRALKLNYEHSKDTRQKSEPDVIETSESTRGKVAEIISEIDKSGRTLILDKSLDIINQYGVQTPGKRFVTGVAEAIRAAESLGYPVALKVMSNDLSHKSDLGGVHLNLMSESQVASSIDSMKQDIFRVAPNSSIDGFVVQSMVKGGFELILGGRRDIHFGPVVMVGLGGVYVEVFNQAVLRIAPISEADAYDMIDELPGGQILKGVRGQDPYDVESVVRALRALSQLMIDFPRISEIDINPLIVMPSNNGCYAVDGRIYLSD